MSQKVQSVMVVAQNCTFPVSVCIVAKYVQFFSDSPHKCLWILIEIFLFGLLSKSRGTFSLINYWTFRCSDFRSCFLYCFGKNCLCMLLTCYFSYRLRRSSIPAFAVYSGEYGIQYLSPQFGEDVICHCGFTYSNISRSFIVFWPLIIPPAFSSSFLVLLLVGRPNGGI